MKKAFYLLIVVAMLALLPAAAMGQSGVTWDSGILVQNVGAADADCTVYYYNNGAEGGGLNTSANYTIPVGGSQTIYPLDAADGFNGSVVIECTEPVVAITNELGDGLKYGASYEGFEMGSDTVRLPNVQSDNNGFYSFFNVQNAGSATANVTVQFIAEPGGGYASIANQTCTIDPGEACTFSQQPGQGAWTVGKWVGGATVTANQPVVASANIVHEPGLWGMSSYSGFTGSGSATAILPNIMNANGNYWSGINITNGGGAATTITLKFTPEAGYAALSDRTFTNVAPGATVVFLMPDHPSLGATTKWVGSVEVDGGGQNIFVIVNTLNTVAGEVAAWKGFDPGQATDKVVMPAVLSDGAGYPFFTGFQVVNVGGSATNVTVTYGTNSGGSYSPPADTASIPAGGSVVFLQSGGAWTGNKYIGSATVTNDNGMPMLAIVNEIAPSLFATGEATNSYNAFNE
jgi:hypothetical protein